jgi:peptide chain release factor 1
MLPQDKLDLILRRHDEISAKLSAGASGQEFVALSRELSDLDTLVDAIRAWREGRRELEDVNAMLADAGTDAEMRDMAEEERDAAAQRVEALEQQIRIALLPRDVADEHGAILELRAGTGGDEAALFAGDLYRMYERYAATRGWRVELMSASPGEMGGFKEIIASVTGDSVFARLKFESGVHRVQRVPATETQGRIHTSAATVAVLPEAAQLEAPEPAPKTLVARTMPSTLTVRNCVALPRPPFAVTLSVAPLVVE